MFITTKITSVFPHFGLFLITRDNKFFTLNVGNLGLKEFIYNREFQRILESRGQIH